MCSESDLLVDLVNHLEFTPVDDSTAMGEFHGLPAAISILGLEPPAFAFRIRLNPAGDVAATEQEEIEPLVSDTEVAMSIENGCAWLSVYDAQMFDFDEARGLLDRLAESLIESGQARPGLCMRCDRVEEAELRYVENRPTRICNYCLSRAAEEREQKEAELNPISAKAALSLPVFALVGAWLWAGFWFAVDLAMIYWNINQIELHAISMLLILGLLSGVGWAVGFPTGRVLRKTVFGQRAPRVTGVLLACTVAVVGEILLGAIVIYQEFGVFDLLLSVVFAWLLLFEYTGFWLLCKLTLAIAVGTCCCIGAERKTVSLEI